ncbi:MULTISPECIES: hypothetical protein [Trichocoleus]|uniref:Uncharacterized protein n=1 Tax=Trichocoleus desertorum GB2-A4 TaxID=2933944 RepID=A0ABV0J177_9CYAN|nr:hypothetical protein [Trichocoleus sp. FACHB-46]MBD1860144.1 hypothetical protein [Trichocoleus sp. FACHB-46]
MSHFLALVLIPPDATAIETEVAKLLKPYYSELTVAPYKEYLNQVAVAREVERLQQLPKQAIAKLAEDWEVAQDDLEAMAKYELDWFEDEIAGVDEKGSYRLTTINPLGKWDSYRFIQEESRESGAPLPYPCLVSTLPPVVPYALVTPDGQWHEIGMDAGIKAFARQLRGEIIPSQDETAWDLEVERLLQQYPNYLAIALDCHC